MTVYNPFFERYLRRLTLPFIGKILVSILLGSCVFTLHYAALKVPGPIDLPTWLLAGVAFFASIAIYIASSELGMLIKQLLLRNDSNQGLNTILEKLGDKYFLLTALFFGFANCGVGLLLAFDTNIVSNPILLLIAYFICGFINGIAVWGIFIVVLIVHHIAQDKPFEFDYTSPDQCGGTSFIGSSLLKFGMVTLFVGFFIGAYIVSFKWSATTSDWIQIIKWFWVTFPFIMSLLVSFAPAMDLNFTLRTYKDVTNQNMKSELMSLSAELSNKNTSPEQRKQLEELLKIKEQERTQLHSMKCWPFMLINRAEYVSVFVAHLGVVATYIEDIQNRVQGLAG